MKDSNGLSSYKTKKFSVSKVQQLLIIKFTSGKLKKTVKFSTDTITYRGPHILNLIPENIRNASSFKFHRKK